MAGVDLATTKQLPTMGSCETCHTAAANPDHCTDCHLALRGGLLATKFDQGDLVPGADGLGDAHAPGFAEHHTVEARQPGATCNACHDQSECVGCHQGVTKPTDFHPGDYTLTHAIDARRGKPDCSACHRLESFCVACQRAQRRRDARPDRLQRRRSDARVPPAGLGRADRRRRRQPARAGGAPEHLGVHLVPPRRGLPEVPHGRGPGQGNVSPHPKNWRGSARCKALDRSDRRMCLRCHVTSNELGCDW